MQNINNNMVKNNIITITLLGILNVIALIYFIYKRQNTSEHVLIFNIMIIIIVIVLVVVAYFFVYLVVNKLVLSRNKSKNKNTIFAKILNNFIKYITIIIVIISIIFAINDIFAPIKRYTVQYDMRLDIKTLVTKPIFYFNKEENGHQQQQNISFQDICATVINVEEDELKHTSLYKWCKKNIPDHSKPQNIHLFNLLSYYTLQSMIKDHFPTFVNDIAIINNDQAPNTAYKARLEAYNAILRDLLNKSNKYHLSMHPSFYNLDYINQLKEIYVHEQKIIDTALNSSFVTNEYTKNNLTRDIIQNFIEHFLSRSYYLTWQSYSLKSNNIWLKPNEQGIIPYENFKEVLNKLATIEARKGGSFDYDFDIIKETLEQK